MQYCFPFATPLSLLLVICIRLESKHTRLSQFRISNDGKIIESLSPMFQFQRSIVFAHLLCPEISL